MKTELSYASFSVFAAATLLWLWSQLVQKFSLFTIWQLLHSCYQSLFSFLSNTYYAFGMMIIVGLALSLLGVLMKVVLSLPKTRRVAQLLAAQLPTGIPRKLQRLLLKHELAPRNVLVLRSEQPLAFTFGLVEPKMVFSTSLIKMLTPAQLEAVLLHELHHQQRFHPLFIMANEVVLGLFCFFPIMNELVEKMRARFEHDADAFALAVQGTPRFVIASLRKLSHTGSRLAVGETAFLTAFATPSTAWRIEQLLDQRQAPRAINWLKFGISLVVVMVLTVLYLWPTTLPVAAEMPPTANGGQCFVSQPVLAPMSTFAQFSASSL